MRPGIAALAPFFLMAVMRPGTSLAAGDLSELEQTGTLRVLAVVVEDEPQFFSLRPGSHPGFDREILEGFARLRKLNLEVVRQPSWDALVPALLEGKGDVIAGRFTATETRRQRITFTTETFPTRNVVISRKPHRPIESLEQLSGETVGIVKGTSLAEVAGGLRLSKHGLDDQIPAGGLPAALRSGRVTCAIDELAGAILLQRADPDVQIGAFVGAPGSYAFGVRKESPQLLKSLNEYIENLRRTPTWNRLVVKYFGEAAVEVLNKARAR
jgi:membrane-bound lytic murein transglycosylase F